jgi:hypothetical protein
MANDFQEDFENFLAENPNAPMHWRYGDSPGFVKEVKDTTNVEMPTITQHKGLSPADVLHRHQKSMELIKKNMKK